MERAGRVSDTIAADLLKGLVYYRARQWKREEGCVKRFIGCDPEPATCLLNPRRGRSHAQSCKR